MAQQSGYTSSEIISMQNDAVRRVNEMQRLSRERVKNDNLHVLHSGQGSLSEEKPQKPIENHTQHTTPQPIEVCEPEIVSNGFAGILEKLDLDDEKLLLILLIILLVNEGADIILILALGFILLA